jgi:subtilisin-like proprotein convertase family protein
MLFGVLVLALSATVGLTAGAVEAKKKKAKTFSSKLTPNAGIPDDATTGPSTPVISTIKVPKKFKKLQVADVNVTGLTTTGSGAGAANDLEANLTAPNGRTVRLFARQGDQNLGPWTMDDDTKTEICDSATLTCGEPNATLIQPFAGTSNLLQTENDSGSDGIGGPLSNFDLLKMRGTWTLEIWDESSAGTTSILNSWGLQIKPLKLKPPTVEVE